ncbi:aldehyde dehydrogenase family protein [uncultured Tateyamaria sp.]|uniref:aldehyde dehydrogenase family protein n=1 Tax=uncultured Tateyamaria sp. TaxID=455651 RepID=UPI00261910C5|nr:aldehyde dehydrogenase family protein [uncultured Tateyamaria sp.]
MKPNLIGGAWVEGGEAAENINPSDTDDVIGIYAQAGRAETEQAIAAAEAAFTDWSVSPVQQRHDILRHIGDAILARCDEIAEMLAREEGKILSEARAETERAGRIFLFFAGEALRLTGEVMPSVRPGVGVEITREPVGPVGLITPWNFPIAIPAWKIAPALCHGNTVVFKPAELVPGTAWLLAEIIAGSGLPAGVFNLVMGVGRVVGQTMLDTRALRAISFTGSQATGQLVAEACLRHQRKFQLEMGGKNPLVVLDDADLELATDVALDGAFFSTGQRCTASSRLIVTDDIHARFVEQLTEKLRTLTVGHALDPASKMGPVVDQVQLEQDLDFIAGARRDGANLRAGGALVQCRTRGFFLAPTLFTDTDPAMRINREEVFGPVATVIRARDYDHALMLANDTPFGLTAGICTRSLKFSQHFKRYAQAGMVMVNLPTAGVDYHVPFGGAKGSSFGPREQGRHAAEFFTTVKTAYTRSY